MLKGVLCTVAVLLPGVLCDLPGGPWEVAYTDLSEARLVLGVGSPT